MSSKTRQAERDLLESDDNSKSSKMSSKQKSNANKKKSRRLTALSESSDSDSNYSIRKSTKNTRRTTNAKLTKKTEKNKLEVPRSVSRTSRSGRGNNLTRADSNSSSDKEFMKNKIFDSSFHLEIINEFTKKKFDNVNDDDNADKILSKNEAFHFKNYLQKCFQQFKSISTKLINDVEHTKKLYYHKENLKFSDTTMAIIECKNIIRDLRDSANDCEKQLVARYNNWCKITKNKNLLINDDQPKDTPKRWESTSKKEVVVASSGNEDSDLDARSTSSKKNNLVNGHVDDKQKNRVETAENVNDKDKCDSPVETDILTPPSKEVEEEMEKDIVDNHVENASDPADLDASGDLFSDAEEDSEKDAKQALLTSSPDSSEENFKSPERNSSKPASESDNGSVGKQKKKSDVLLISSESEAEKLNAKAKSKQLKKKSSKDLSTESSDESLEKLGSKQSSKKASKDASSESDADILEEKSKSKTSSKKTSKDSSSESDAEILQEKLTTKTVSEKGSKNSSSESDAEISKEKLKTETSKNASKDSSSESDRDTLEKKLKTKTLSEKDSKDSSSESDAEISKEKLKTKTSKKASKDSSSESDEQTLEERLMSKSLSKKSSKGSCSESDTENLKEKVESKKSSTKSSDLSDSDDKTSKTKKKSPSSRKSSKKSSSDSSDSDAKHSKKKTTDKKSSSDSSDSDTETLREKTNSEKSPINSSSDSDDKSSEGKKKGKKSSSKLSSLAPEELTEKKAKEKLLASSSDSDDKKSEEKEVEKDLLDSSSDSDEKKSETEKTHEKPTSDSVESDQNDLSGEERAKARLLKSSSDSERDDVGQDKINSVDETPDNEGEVEGSASEKNDRVNSESPKAPCDSPKTKNNDESKEAEEEKEEEKESEPQKSSETKNVDETREEELTQSQKSTESLKKSPNNKKSSPKDKNNKKSKEIIDDVDSDSDDDSETKAKLKLLSSSSELDEDANDSKESSVKSVNGKRNTDNSESNSSNTSKGKKNKLILSKNKYYKKDKKLRMKCIVDVKRLSTKVLAKHSKAIQLSKDYLESKQVLSLLSLDNLEKRKTKRSRNAATSSEDENSSRSKTKKKTKNTTEEETLLDHLKKVEAGDKEGLVNSDISDTDSPIKEVEEKKELSIAEAHDNAIKAALLESSGSETEMAPHNDLAETTDEKDDNKDKKRNKDKKSKDVKETEKKDDKEEAEIVELDDDDDDENDNNEEKDDDDNDEKKKDLQKSSWKKSKILSTKFSSTDSEEENEKIQRRLSQRSSKKSDSDSDKEPGSSSIKKKKPRTRRRILGSDDDSDIMLTDDSSDDDSSDKKKNGNDKKKEDDKKSAKRRKKSDSDSDSDSIKEKKKPKRRRIRTVSDDSDDSDEEGRHNSQASGKGSGRKNIRKVMKDKQVAEDTLVAAKQEEERLRRMAERQKIYNEMYETRLANEEKVDKLILDFDEETKEPLLSADENLVKRLKPHQAKGIKFMWDACFESLERVKTTEGSGCILAHCMGLGKSFQVVTLAHTLLTNNDKTGINNVMIVAPLSTVLNWMNEFKTWLSEVENGDDIELYEMTKAKTTLERKCQLENWQRTGGVLIIGYEMFRNLCAIKGKVRKSVQEAILKCILDPGPDLVVCDEGHLLKREDSAVSKAMRRIRTLRRVVLTGTPLQNNLFEYHCMVQFVKPNLLGTKKEFSNRFVNPIQNGQFDDSTEYDVKIMKKRAHVLHKMLEGSVQRFDYSVLTPFLPPKQEYVILVNLTQVQCEMYQYYLDNLSRRQVRVGGSLFADFQGLHRIWTHPYVMKLHSENSEKMREKKREAESDSEGSLRDFIDDDSDSASSTSRSGSNSDGSDVVAINDDKQPVKRSTRANPLEEEPPPEEEPPAEHTEWWSAYVNPEHYDDLRASSKLRILFDILKEAEQIGDKVLVFSQSLYSLSLIEKFLGMIDDETQNSNELETLDKHTGSWSLGLDYFRFDGQTSAENRSAWVKSFNKPSNTRARLFLISTRAGGLGINLTAANRVVIFDASWNPSHDVQSIFRIYRFGQKKPCYVYRLLAAGTMEEKIYNRQVTKLSLSCRVVDELQIERHYGSHDLAELYRLELPKKDPPTLALPKDRLLAEIFLRHKTLVDNYHEHDSLLENIAEEELDEEERKQAWAEYEDEKAGKRMMQPMMGMGMNPQMILYHNQMMNAVNLNNPIQQGELGKLLEMIKKDYPHVSETSQKEMAFRALNNMYNYVENQFTANTPANVPTMNIPNIPTINPPGAPTATLANMLAQQEYSRAHGQFNQMQRQLQYAQQYGNNIGHIQAKPGRPPKNPPNNYAARFASTDDEIMEIPTSSRGNTTQGNSGKRQEE